MGLLLPSCVGVWGWNSGLIISIGMCFCTDRDVLFGQHEFSVGIGYYILIIWADDQALPILQIKDLQ